MERRLSVRKLVDVSVYMSYAGRPMTRAVASDISDAGIYLKTNPLFVPKKKPIELVFALHLGSSNVVRLRRVPAIVTRCERNGVGMTFCDSKTSRY
jgi:hypothetical protein